MNVVVIMPDASKGHALMRTVWLILGKVPYLRNVCLLVISAHIVNEISCVVQHVSKFDPDQGPNRILA